jgi:hypothetical protein
MANTLEYEVLVRGAPNRVWIHCGACKATYPKGVSHPCTLEVVERQRTHDDALLNIARPDGHLGAVTD